VKNPNAPQFSDTESLQIEEAGQEEFSLNLQQDPDNFEDHSDEFSKSFKKKPSLLTSRIRQAREVTLTDSEEENIRHLKKEKINSLQKKQSSTGQNPQD
jgi:hypothetical protein